MLRFGIAALTIFAIETVKAENILLEPPLKPIPSRSALAPISSEPSVATKRPEDLPVNVDAIASELKAQFENFVKAGGQSAPSCSDAKAADYALALHILGKYDECAAFAELCAKQQVVSPRVICRGASCRAARYQFDQADALFQAATAAKFAASPDYGDVVYSYAEFSMYWIHPERVPQILALNKTSSAQDLILWEALIKRVGRLDLGKIQKSDVDNFLNQQMPKSSGDTLSHLKAVHLAVLAGDYKYADAMAVLEQDAPSYRNPLLWYDAAYSVLYFGLNDAFAEARKIYDVSDLYSTPYTTLPTEQNTYNYTEIYKSVCTKTLMAGTARKHFESLKSQIRTGQLSSQQALSAAADFANTYPGRADVLTMYGGLLALAGQHTQAMQTYWQAHRLCRYYNRANWGLVLEKRFFKYTAMPDYDTNAQKVERELGSRQIPSQISSYISDWNALDAQTQRRVEYGMRIWLPWVQLLDATNFSTYIKFAFDLLSDSPNSADLRDQRIGGVGYPNDNRLWDDVRGAGGETVIADASEVFQTVQGDYNLLGHEMTHQFQALMEKKYPAGVTCIQSIYDHASAAQNFPDAYSSQNKEEHFAQGVTYYLVPADSPKRFGLNQTWLVEHNQEQLSFIKSIEAAAGDLNKISCAQK